MIGTSDTTYRVTEVERTCRHPVARGGVLAFRTERSLPLLELSVEFGDEVLSV